MSPAVIVLGPSKWIDEDDPDRIMERPPLDLRRAIAERFRKLGAPALVLEDEQKIEDEDHFDFFLRVLDERNVQTFVVFWPVGARLHGLDVEIGHLLTRMSEDDLDPDAVYLLPEKRSMDIDDRDGIVAWKEPQNRTWYHQDLVARGCRVRRWSSEGSLWTHVGSISWEHQQRYSSG